LPQLGRLQFFLATKMGWFVVVFIPAMVIIILDVIKIFKLYVLKDQIDKVKSHKEAEKVKVEKELKERDVPLVTLQNKALKVRTQKDKTIDTVELPKIGDDGKIKENTLELPIIKNSRSFTNEKPKIDNIEVKPTVKVTEPVKEIIEPIPKIEEKKEIEIPILKKNDSDKIEIDNLEIQKKILKRKDN